MRILPPGLFSVQCSLMLSLCNAEPICGDITRLEGNMEPHWPNSVSSQLWKPRPGVKRMIQMGGRTRARLPARRLQSGCAFSHSGTSRRPSSAPPCQVWWTVLQSWPQLEERAEPSTASFASGLCPWSTGARHLHGSPLRPLVRPSHLADAQAEASPGRSHQARSGTRPQLVRFLSLLAAPLPPHAASCDPSDVLLCL